MWRDWTYVEDIADGVILALDKPLGYDPQTTVLEGVSAFWEWYKDANSL